MSYPFLIDFSGNIASIALITRIVRTAITLRIVLTGIALHIALTGITPRVVSTDIAPRIAFAAITVPNVLTILAIFTAFENITTIHKNIHITACIAIIYNTANSQTKIQRNAGLHRRSEIVCLCKQQVVFFGTKINFVPKNQLASDLKVGGKRLPPKSAIGYGASEKKLELAACLNKENYKINPTRKFIFTPFGFIEQR